jgi:hypothetical protein
LVADSATTFCDGCHGTKRTETNSFNWKCPKMRLLMYKNHRCHSRNSSGSGI